MEKFILWNDYFFLMIDYRLDSIPDDQSDDEYLQEVYGKVMSDVLILMLWVIKELRKKHE